MTMKKYIFPILFSGLALACTEEDLVRYDQDKDGLQFYSGDQSVLVENDASSLQRGFNFAGITYREKKPGDRQEETYYYGDSLASFTYENVLMQIQGFPSPDERPYRLKAVKLEGEESDFVPEVIFEPFYSVAPHAILDTIRFTIVRPKKDGRFMRGVYRFGIAIDTENSPFFEKGATERNVLVVTVRDVYEKPDFWEARKEWLGEFDQEKYAFMLTYSQLPFTRDNEKMRDRTEVYNQELLAYLNEHPGIAEHFETPLPDMPKMVWWDANAYLLGEYSREKFEFMQGVLKGEPLQNNDKLLYWNIRCREEDKESAFGFPRNERESSWWNSQALGGFTPEKQEYVIRCIFETCRLDHIPGDVWDYVPSVLRLEADAYNAEHPEAPLDFSFPEDNGKPEWWGIREALFAEFSPVKRDLIIKAVFEANRDNPWEPNKGISQLADGYLNNNSFASMYLNQIKEAVAAYNATHEEQIELSTLPLWWNERCLGTYSKEKQAFVQKVMAQYGQNSPDWVEWIPWNPVIRFEAVAQGVGFDIPELSAEEIKPGYWDNFKYLGDFSVTKFVFTWITIAPLNWGRVDEWYLSGEYGMIPLEDRYNDLIEAYKKDYKTFMEDFAKTAEAFSYPASFPGN